jgi:hypothetical protein
MISQLQIMWSLQKWRWNYTIHAAERAFVEGVWCVYSSTPSPEILIGVRSAMQRRRAMDQMKMTSTR